MRPLDFARSIKLKLGLVIVAAVAVTVIVVTLGSRAELSPWVTGIAAALLALGIVEVLARGMTSPLREMVAATREMARGKYDRRVTATSRDEVGELARAFNAMAAELAEVDRLRRDIVANVSHELRTPLGALRAKLENLVDDVEEADQATLRAMLHQVERLSNLVSQLLDLSKLEAGAVPLQRSSFQAALLLAQVADEWRTRAEIRDIRVETAVEPETLALQGDEQRLRQVLSNLVANAIRHSPRGGRVVVRAAENGEAVCLEVSDEGPGIPAGESERVFERFYRSDAARSSAEGGSGLGLAIARWIVELHGGSIRVAADQQEGCRVIVALPR